MESRAKTYKCRPLTPPRHWLRQRSRLLPQLALLHQHQRHKRPSVLLSRRSPQTRPARRGYNYQRGTRDGSQVLVALRLPLMRIYYVSKALKFVLVPQVLLHVISEDLESSLTLRPMNPCLSWTIKRQKGALARSERSRV